MSKYFWRKVKKPDGCWEYQGYRDKNGYGKTSVNTKVISAHRFAWEFYNGKIPEGMVVCHKCDNPPCVRPDHLFLGTTMENYRDYVQKFGHPKNNGGKRNSKCNGVKKKSVYLTDAQAQEIQAIYAKGLLGSTLIGRMFNVSGRTVRDIVQGKTHKELLYGRV